ncbi:uncharacterized protein LOC110025196 [Phalaenopsis equestris]|uniref:uncharacterized protein LOC110025196 n=1 Tax=Phalaenopsis equestris TaxID=78828 RepID=UPI0009E26654|nr:uncharacterized protein LOC110025196 [Phalaenopsis equestris]XP_020581176.1 uncharacterized protein LOC110025196 [Phalaenopsis equestris]XP_020581177.1 uncharacterized protein LOC110025196 [Phalaenopsis equestris]XP_020581179.1 uncharacterized protein LOC110025196 [Phalaenopsis equestris]
MQETQPVVQALAATHCNEDSANHQLPSKRKTRLHPQSKQGNVSLQITPSSRCTRSQVAPDWTLQEVLVLLSEIVAIDEVWLKELSSYQRWKMISDNCLAMNVVRSSNQCKRKWEMLLADYKKILNWELLSREESYWSLPEERKKDYGLPVSFQKEVFDAMDAVIQVQQQQSDSNNSDPEQIYSVAELERSTMNADSEISMLYLPSSLHEVQVVTSMSPKVNESTLKRPEKALVLAGDKLITSLNSPKVGDLITVSKSSTERHEMEELSTASKNPEERPDVEELITMSKSSEVEEPLTTLNSSEQRVEVEELNSTSKSVEERAGVEVLVKASKNGEVEGLITASKSPVLEELITVPVEEDYINTSKSSEVDELITTSKSSEKASVITALEQEELITTPNSSEKACLIKAKLQENAEHICAILRAELQTESLNPSAEERQFAETQFTRRTADEVIKSLSELTNSLDELYDHMGGPKCAGIMPVDSMA